jgi:hypothetical protein
MLHKKGVHRRANICGLVCSLTLVMSCEVAQASEISAVGPVEAANCTSGTIRVLGNTFSAVDSSGIRAICSAGTPSELPYVSIKGVIAGDSSLRLTKLTLLSKGQYVPGGSPVYIRGDATGKHLSIGEIGLGGATIQAVPVDFADGAVEVLGTQPVLGGAILAVSINAVASASSASSDLNHSSLGVGVQSSTGSGVLSSTGSGALGSSNAGRLSSTGSGKLSSTGSGVLSSTGSGVLSSTGSGKLSSTGSGKLSSTGSGALSSTGSGVLSSTGSGILSSTGSGIQSE